MRAGELERVCLWLRTGVRGRLSEGCGRVPCSAPSTFHHSPGGPVQPRHDDAKVHARQALDHGGPLLPSCGSGNAGIPKREYLGIPHSFRLPCVADLGKRLVQQGQEAYLWSANVSRPYRQLQVHPSPCPSSASSSTADDMSTSPALRLKELWHGMRPSHQHRSLADEVPGLHAIVYINNFIGCEDHSGAIPWAALIMAYFSLLRQSNLLSPSRAMWGGPLHPATGGRP